VSDLSAFGIPADQLRHHPGLPASRPKPWVGEPITPKPAGYRRLVEEFATYREGHVRALYEVVELHQPAPWSVATDGTVRGWICEGCDSDGYDAEWPSWPCRTSTVVAEVLGVSLEET
jgi:hypothetical protein